MKISFSIRSWMFYLIIFFVFIFVLFPVDLFSCMPATHMYLGMNQYSVWQDFDPEFYEMVTRNYTYPNKIDDIIREIDGRGCRKFYFIGLTLPDIFDSQSMIQEMIKGLYDNREHWVIPVLKNGLYIENSTYNNTRDVFFPNQHGDSHDIDKLRDMCIYVKQNYSDPISRALVYGAYMHVVQDEFAHLLLQPSTFGYGKNYDISVDVTTEHNILGHPENYQEIFTDTYVDNWDFMKDIYDVFFHSSLSVLTNRLGISFDICTGYTIAGDEMYDFQSWEQYWNENISSINAFVQAGDATGYGGFNFDYNHLKAYIHGAGIFLSILYGGINSEWNQIGGPINNHMWATNDILTHYTSQFENYMTGGHIIDCITKVLLWTGNQTALELFSSCPMGMNLLWWNFISMVVQEEIGLTIPWYRIFEDKDSLQLIVNQLPVSFTGLMSAFEIWENNLTQKPVFARSTYSEELQKMNNFTPEIREIINGEKVLTGLMQITPDYSTNIYALSRKAGLLGGLFDVGDAPGGYYDQPGIVDVHFTYFDNYIYDNTTKVWPNSYIGLTYDFFTFGKSTIQIRGNNSVYALSEDILTNVGRNQSTQSIPSFSTYQSGNTELSFEIGTADNLYGSSYTKMMNSDYRTAYNDIPDNIKSGDYGYDYLFKGSTDGANPIRIQGENPLIDPIKYWPYSLPITSALNPENKRQVNFNVAIPITISIRDATWDDGSGTYPNIYRSLLESYYVYINAPKEIYTIKVQKVYVSSTDIWIFSRWEALDIEGNLITLPIDDIENPWIYIPQKNSLETFVVFKQSGITIRPVYQPVNQTNTTLFLGPNNDLHCLSIPAGANIQCANGFKIIVEAVEGESNPGNLDLSAATEANPITFRSMNANPSPGAWKGIEYKKKSLATFNLKYVNIYDAEVGFCFTGDPATETYTYPKIEYCKFENNLVGLNYKNQDHFSAGGNLYLYVDNCYFKDNTIGLTLDNTGKISKFIRWNQFVNNEYGIYAEGYVNYGSTCFDIYQNTIISDQAEIGIGAIGLFYISVENNVIDVSNTGTGILVGNQTDFSYFRPAVLGTAPQSYIYENYEEYYPEISELVYKINNNTVVGGYRGIQCHTPYLSSGKCSIRNNIIINQKNGTEDILPTGAGIIYFSEGYLATYIGYNLVYGQEEDREYMRSDRYSQFTYYEPLGQMFPSTDKYQPDNLTSDYYPSYNSPVIDIGDPDFNRNGTSWVTDVNDRDPDGTRADIGAFYYPQISVSGTISANTTWYGKITITDDVTIASGAELTIDPGTKVAFNSGKKITINGTLDAQGTSANHIVFTSSSSTPYAGLWYGIRFEDSSSDANCILKYCDIQYAQYGVYCNRANPRLISNTISNNDQGISGYIASPTITDNKITGNTDGVYFQYGSPVFYNNSIASNFFGASFYSYASPQFGPKYPESENQEAKGFNVIKENETGIIARYYSEPFMGSSDPYNNRIGGYNSVYGNTFESAFLEMDSYIEAEYNWWNNQYTFHPYEGCSIDYNPYLPTNPGGGSSLGKILSNIKQPNDDDTSGFNPRKPNVNRLSDLWLWANELQITHQTEEAINIYQILINKFPQSKEAKRSLVKIFHLYQEAGKSGLSEYLKGLTDGEKTNPELRRVAFDLLAGTYLRDGNVVNAVNTYDNILVRYPGTESEKMALYNLVLVSNTDLKNSVKASNHLQTLKSKYPNDELALLAAREMGEKVDWSLAKRTRQPEAVKQILPEKFALRNNYPNPFNPRTTIAFDLPEESHVMLTIYDIMGREIVRLLNENQPAGFRHVVWDGKDKSGQTVSSGIYLYTLKTSTGFSETKKMALMR